MDWN